MKRFKKHVFAETCLWNIKFIPTSIDRTFRKLRIWSHLTEEILNGKLHFVCSVLFGILTVNYFFNVNTNKRLVKAKMVKAEKIRKTLSFWYFIGILYILNLFQANVPYLYTLKTSDVFSDYRNGILPRNGSNSLIKKFQKILLTVLMYAMKLQYAEK